MKKTATIAPLDEGYVVTTYDEADDYGHVGQWRIAEPTMQGALTLVARAVGYRGIIRFEPEAELVTRTVEVPVYANIGPAFDAPEVFDDEVALNHGTAVDDRL